MTPTRVILESLLIATIEIAAVKVEQTFGSIPSCLIMPSQTASTFSHTLCEYIGRLLECRGTWT